MKKILLVDDFEELLNSNVLLLSRKKEWKDFQIDSAKNKQEAINYLENNKDGLELIILDLAIPTREEALEVLMKIKEERFPTRILIITGWIDSSIMAKLSPFQIQDILLKSTGCDELSARAKIAISQPKMLC